ncbi:mechanosensitive ion channel family protein [Starkeya sp. ORNL1]|nr:mechanosensitive ion channel family protein [Starkeya sp. ORNL1]
MRCGWATDWSVSLVLFVGAIVLARWVHALAFRIVTRIVGGMDLFWRSLVSRTEGPTRLALMVLALGAAANVVTIIVTLAISAALMSFEGVRQYGVSLLASAGAAVVVVGLALQPVLKNLFAGIQLAVTQPIRMTTYVEEITSTYVVMRLWEIRRTRMRDAQGRRASSGTDKRAPI